jgi:hypothetical protein
MAFANGGRIVTDGLILSLDASDRNSYVSGSTTWNDLSGNGNNATLNGSFSFDTNNGGSIFLDGTNAYTTSPYSGSATSDYTFSAWFKNDNYSEVKYILTRGRDNAGNGWSIQLQVGTSGIAAAAAVPTIPSTSTVGIFSTSTLALNTWYYLTGVWAAGSSVKLYINGLLEATTSTTSTSLRTSSTGWTMGTINATTFTSGYNSISQIYTRVLSDAEILQNYNAQKSRFGLK